MKHSLLTESDLSYITVRGVPYPAREDLTLLSDAGKITFTVKGIQFYKEAIRVYGLSLSVKDLKTEEDLYNISDIILRIKKRSTSSALQAALLRGELDQQEKASVSQRLFGSLSAWFNADIKKNECVSAGNNVIPINFGAGRST